MVPGFNAFCILYSVTLRFICHNSLILLAFFFSFFFFCCGFIFVLKNLYAYPLPIIHIIIWPSLISMIHLQSSPTLNLSFNPLRFLIFVYPDPSVRASKWSPIHDLCFGLLVPFHVFARLPSCHYYS